MAVKKAVHNTKNRGEGRIMSHDIGGSIEGWVHEWSGVISHEIVKGIYDNHEFQTYSKGVSWYIPEAEGHYLYWYEQSFRILSMLRKMEYYGGRDLIKRLREDTKVLWGLFDEHQLRVVCMLTKLEKERPDVKAMFEEQKGIFISPLGLSDWVTSIYRERLRND